MDNFKFDDNGREFPKRLENTLGKGEIAPYEQFLLFTQCFQKTCTADSKNQGLFARRQILDSFKLKEFADDSFKFDENGRKLFKRVENTVGKGEIARYKQFLLFP